MPGNCDGLQTELEISAKQLGLNLQNEMKGIAEKYQVSAQELGNNAPDPSAVEGFINVDFDVNWKNIEISLDLPEFTMNTQEWKLDVPQVSMRDKEIIFHTPSSRMTTKKVGQYPEFHGFRIVWKDILIDIPEFFMEEQRIVMGIPEFRVDTTSFKLDIPEVTMKTQKIIMGLPQFTLRSISGEIQIVAARAEQLKNEAGAEIAAAKQRITSEAGIDIAKKANSLFTCLRTSIQMKKDEAMAMIEPGITMLQQSITKMSSINADEARAQMSDLQGKLNEAIARRSAIEGRFSEAIDGLLKQEQDTVSRLLGGLVKA